MQNRAMHWPNAPFHADPPPGSDEDDKPKAGYETEVPPRRPDDKDPKKKPEEGGKSGS